MVDNIGCYLPAFAGAVAAAWACFHGPVVLSFDNDDSPVKKMKQNILVTEIFALTSNMIQKISVTNILDEARIEYSGTATIIRNNSSGPGF